MAWDDEAPTEDEIKKADAALGQSNEPSWDAEPPTAEQLKLASSGGPVNLTKPNDLSAQASAGIESVGRGATLGFGDEAAGVTGAIGETLARGLGGADIPAPAGDDSLSRLQNLYAEYRDSARRREEKQKEAFPATTFAGEMAGGFALPGGSLTKGIQGMSKGLQATRLAAVSGLAGGLASAGMTKANPIDQTAEFMGDVGMGTAGGTVLGGAMLPVASALGSGVNKMTKVIKEVPAIAGALEQFRRGLKGEKLVGTEAAQNVGTEMAQFGMDAFKKLIGTSKDPGEVLRSGKLREEILKNAKASGQEIPIEKVDEIINDLREKLLNIKDLSPAAGREAAQLQEILATSKEGKEVQRLKKEALPLKENLIEQKEHLLRDKLVREKGIDPEDISSEFVKTDDPNIVVGRVMQKTKGIDPVNEMEQLVSVQRAKLKVDDGDLRYDFVPGDDPNLTVARVHQKIKPVDTNEEMKQLLSLQRSKKQATENVRPDDFSYEVTPSENPKEMVGRIYQIARDGEGNPTGRKVLQQRIFSPEEVEGTEKVIQQKIFDKRNMSTSMKSLAQKDFQTSELGPQFKESMETVREGGRDLTNPSEVDTLRQGISSFAKMGDKPAQSREVLGAASEATTKLSQALQESVPEYATATTKFGAAKDAVKALGIDESRTPQEARDKIISYLNQLYKEDATGIIAKERLKDFRKELATANPELERSMGPTFEELSRKYELVRETTKPGFLLLGGMTPRGAGYALGNVTGRFLKAVGELPPEGFQQIASKLTSKGTSASVGLAKVLEQAATKDLRGRNALMFSIMQNPAYRKMLEESTPELFQEKKPK